MDFEDFRADHLFFARFCAVVPRDHPLAERDILTFEDLADQPLIGYSRKKAAPRRFARMAFLLLIVGCIVSRTALTAAFAGAGPASIVFFALWVLGMVAMSLFAVKLDSADPKSNWIEQITNGVAELCLCIGLALL